MWFSQHRVVLFTRVYSNACFIRSSYLTRWRQQHYTWDFWWYRCRQRQTPAVNLNMNTIDVLSATFTFDTSGRHFSLSTSDKRNIFELQRFHWWEQLWQRLPKLNFVDSFNYCTGTQSNHVNEIQAWSETFHERELHHLANAHVDFSIVLAVETGNTNQIPIWFPIIRCLTESAIQPHRLMTTLSGSTSAECVYICMYACMHVCM